MRRLAAAVAVALLALGAACSDRSVGVGEAVVSIEPGSRVLIGERSQGLRQVEGRRTVHRGAQVKVLAGSASIALADGAHLDARAGTELEIGPLHSLVAKDLLVTSGGKPVDVEVAGSRITVDGVARLTRDLAVSAAAYRGTVTLHSAARSLDVPALRQAQIPSLGVLPARPEPLDYDTTDAWDRRFLGTAMELGDQLDARSTGFTNQLKAGEGSTPGFYRILLPALESEPAFGEELISGAGNPGDTLVGAAITVTGKLGTFAERWDNVFGFKAAGASWGLVALDQQVNDVEGLVHTVDVAIGTQTFSFAPTQVAAPQVVDPPPAPAEVAVPPAPTVQQRSPAGPAPAPTPAATPAAEPPPLITLPQLPELVPPPDPNDPGLLAPLLNVVTDTLSGLLAGG